LSEKFWDATLFLCCFSICCLKRHCEHNDVTVGQLGPNLQNIIFKNLKIVIQSSQLCLIFVINEQVTMS